MFLLSDFLIFRNCSRSSTQLVPFVLMYGDGQAEQREELSQLLRKYGHAWEPWRKELEKFKGSGQELFKQKN